MAINERLIDTAVAAADGDTGNAGKQGLILHLDANDVDSYDGDGTEWIDITDHEYTPSIDVSEHFNAVLFSPSSSGITSITGVGFQPDLVWTKNRDSTWYHQLYDSVRGGGNNLYVNDTHAENSPSLPISHLDSLDSDGFTVDYSENIGDDHVAWCFKAGGAPSGSDTVSIDGTSYANEAAAGLTAGSAAVGKLSVNTKLGFSIATGSVAVNGYTNTYCHGLEVKPDMIITKVSGATSDWVTILPNMSNDLLKLNTNDSTSTDSFFEGTSTILKTGYSTGAYDFVAYSFASKRGVSKVGSYTGTNAAGNKVYTGFEPAFVMIKSTSFDERWAIYDNKRSEENPRSKVLAADVLDSEINTVYYNIDFNRDGFTVNGTANFTNKNGEKFIYYAVAKNTNETSLIPDTDLELHLDAASFPEKGESGYDNTPSTWTDSSGNSNNGTITGATFDSELGNYLEFGSGKHVTTTYDLPTSGGVSIELWFNANSGTTSYLAGNDNGSSDLRNQISVGAHTGAHTDESITYYQSFGNVFTGGHLIIYVREGHDKYQDGKWHHLVIVGTGSGHEVYVDGESKTFTYGTGGTQANQDILWTNFCLGKTNFNSNHYMNGKVGQCRIYETALTQAQISQNYNFTKPNYPNGYDGAISGATWNSGGYFTFDGSGDYINLAENILSTTPVASVSLWAKGSTLATNTTQYKIIYNNANGGFFFTLLVGEGNLEVYIRNSSGTNIIPISYPVSNFNANDWYHITVTFSGLNSAVNLYVNGSLVDTGTFPTTTTVYTQYYNAIGGDPASGAAFTMVGSVSKVKAYNKTLTSAEITALYNEGR